MSLFEISAEVRIIIKWAAIGIAVLFFIWVIFISVSALIKVISSPKQNLPTTTFGKLPLPLSPNADLSKITFELNTETGSLPASPALMKVYPIPEPTGKINSLDLATSLVNRMGIRGNPKKISPTLYQFQDSQFRAKSVTIDIISGNFTYNYDWIADPSALNKVFDQPVDKDAETQARSFINSIVSGTNDLANGVAKTSYVRVAGSQRIPVSSASEANAVEVQLFRENIEQKYPVLTSDPNRSLVNALVVPDNGDKNILQVNFTHWLIDFTNSSTYPIRSSAQAFADLNNNKANVVEGTLSGVTRVTISSVQLAYLETEKYSSYLQPVYLFKGTAIAGKSKADFAAYVPAVTEDWLEKIQ